MTWTMRIPRAQLAAILAAAVFFAFPQFSKASPQSGAGAQSQASAPAADDAAARLDKKQFNDVHVAEDKGIATLTGTVDLYVYKADAEKRVRKAKSVTAVRNLIEVAGPAISDKDLQAKLQEKLTYDRVGYGNTFNAIAVGVENGVVTVGGHARTYVDKDSALALIATTPGVKEVAGEIEVDPVSIMDDQTRIEVARAIYGYGSLSRYAIDPAMPIRISVQNGHVELYGTVDTQGDKDTAYLRAMGVSGTFSVKNYLQVASATNEKKK